MSKSSIDDQGRYRQNRGIGRLKDYKPWIRVIEVPSKGRSHRVYCEKTSRHHELLSDMEEYFFWLCVWDERVIDIREQFPLLPQLKTLSIASKFGFQHPSYKNNDIVMTTDFVITMLKHGKMVDIARSVKTKKDLEKSRTREKLAIERQFWTDKQIDWALITEESFSIYFAKNIKMLSGIQKWRFNVPIQKEHIELLCKMLLAKHTRAIDCIPITISLDDQFKLEPGTSLNILKWLIWTKQINVNMNKEVLDFRKLELIRSD